LRQILNTFRPLLVSRRLPRPWTLLGPENEVNKWRQVETRALTFLICSRRGVLHTFEGPRALLLMYSRGGLRRSAQTCQTCEGDVCAQRGCSTVSGFLETFCHCGSSEGSDVKDLAAPPPRKTGSGTIRAHVCTKSRTWLCCWNGGGSGVKRQRAGIAHGCDTAWRRGVGR